MSFGSIETLIDALQDRRRRFSVNGEQKIQRACSPRFDPGLLDASYVRQSATLGPGYRVNAD